VWKPPSPRWGKHPLLRSTSIPSAFYLQSPLFSSPLRWISLFNCVKDKGLQFWPFNIGAHTTSPTPPLFSASARFVIPHRTSTNFDKTPVVRNHSFWCPPFLFLRCIRFASPTNCRSPSPHFGVMYCYRCLPEHEILFFFPLSFPDFSLPFYPCMPLTLPFPSPFSFLPGILSSIPRQNYDLTPLFPFPDAISTLSYSCPHFLQGYPSILIRQFCSCLFPLISKPIPLSRLLFGFFLILIWEP